MSRAVVVPVGNEPDIIGFVAELFLAVNPAAIYFVIDGATDIDTRRRLNTAIETYAPSGHIILGPGGLANAYLAGYQAALRGGCDVLLEMDVGHPASMADTALRIIEDGWDFVPGVRWGANGAEYDKKGAWHRWALSRWGSALVEYATADHRLKDWTSGFHAMSLDVLEEVLVEVQKNPPPGRWWQTAVRVAAMRAAENVIPVPIAYKPTGRVPLRDVVASLGQVAKLWRDGP